MRLPSIDFGSRRHRDNNHINKLPTLSTAESSRSLASVLHHWQDPATPNDLGAPLSGTLAVRSSSSRSLSSKLQRAFIPRKHSTPAYGTLDISAPLSTRVLHPGLALNEFGTPTRVTEDWEFLRRSPEDEWGYGRTSLALEPPSLPYIPHNDSPLLSRAQLDPSSLGSPYYLSSSPGSLRPESSQSSRYSVSPRKAQPQHARHKSVPTLLSAFSRTPVGRPFTPSSPHETPTRPRNSNKRAAFYELSPHIDAMLDPPPRVGSPTISACSTTSSQQFKIRRKPVPRLDIECSLSDMSRTPSGSTLSNRSVSGGSASTSLSHHFGSSSFDSFVTIGLPIQEAPPSVALPADTSQSTAESFHREIDTLFEELMDQCRTLDTAASQTTPTRPQHRRAMSLQPTTPQSPHRRSMSLLSPGLPPERHSSIRRVRIIRKGFSDGPSTLERMPNSEMLDDVKESDEQVPGEEKENAGFETPRPKHRRVADLRPFFPSGRSFEPIRGAPAPPVVVSTPGPTQTPGRVKTAVREIEHPSAANVTPVSKLGTLLQKKARVGSDELTLESKRMMAEARRRRANLGNANAK